MKKVLVATCVMAMAAFGITHASADPVSSARGSAYGINLSLLGEDLLDHEPEVTSVLGDGLVSSDIITPEVEPVTVAGTGVVVANTSVESTIPPFTFDGGAALRGGDQTAGTGDDLLGGILGDLLGGDGGTTGGLTDNLLGGGGGGTGILSEGDADRVEAQQLDGLTGGGDEGTLGGLLGGELLGGLLDGGDEGDQVGADDQITIPFVNAQGFARVEDLNVLTEDASGTGLLGELSSLPTEVQALLIEALLEVEAVTAEAVAVCVDNQIFFDTASNILSIDNEPVTAIDDLLGTISDLTEDLGVLEVVTNEVGVTDDGNGVFVNALRISLLDDLGSGTLLGGEEGTTTTIPVATTIPLTTTTAVTGAVADNVDSIVGNNSAGEAATVEIQQLGGDGGGDEPALELIIGHAEVSGNVCAQQVQPPVTPLVPTGPGDTLPVTGGGFGILPAVAALGLAGGAVAAGRLALRARREHTL